MKTKVPSNEAAKAILAVIVTSWKKWGMITYLQSATYLVYTLSFHSTFSVPNDTTLFIVHSFYLFPYSTLLVCSAIAAQRCLEGRGLNGQASEVKKGSR